MALDVPAPRARFPGNFGHKTAFQWPVHVATSEIDTVLFERLRKSSTVRVAPSAQLVQTALAAGRVRQRYCAAEQGAGLDVHTTVPGSQQAVADATDATGGAGLFLLVVGSDSY